jgi:hypothetical protein
MNESRSSRPGLAMRLGAELAIIVVGVLLALWADAWVGARADRRIEHNRVEALRDNVVASRGRLESASEEAQAAYDALAEIAYWQDPARVSEREDLVLQGFLFGPVFTPEVNLYADLKSSGDLALLTNVDLRQAPARMDATFEQLDLLQADLTMVQQLNFDPFVVREFALGATMGPYLGLEDLPADAPSPDVDPRILRNLALFKLDLVEQLMAKYADAADALDAVEAAMREDEQAGR